MWFVTVLMAAVAAVLPSQLIVVDHVWADVRVFNPDGLSTIRERRAILPFR